MTMANFVQDVIHQDRWFVHPRFCYLGTWQNRSSQTLCRFEVELDIGPPVQDYGTKQADPLLQHRASIAPPVRFIFDTGATVTLLAGEPARKLLLWTKSVTTELRIADGSVVLCPRGYISIYIFGRPINVECCFLVGESAPGIIKRFLDSIGLTRRASRDNRVDNLLGMNGLLDSHLFGVTHAELGVFRHSQI